MNHFRSAHAFRDWLREHHSDRDELWVGYWKKSTGRPSMTWEESVDEALCFGWIDGVRKRVDDDSYTIRFTPRRAGSVWSRRNVRRYEALEASGRIEPAGTAAYARRTEDRSGMYSFEQEVTPTLSGDYLARLRANERAWADWIARPDGYRKQVAHWIMSAKRESTRARRLAALIEDSA
ncbi:MAG: YdeI/OmpD-associated family protein, partial [Gemmatimonadota bacterium]